MKKINSMVSAVLVVAFMTASLAAAAADSSNKSVVNINTATVAELANLPGVGPSKAEAIVKYRKDRPFKKVEHIMRVKGIGRKSYNAMSPYLTLEGPTTVSKKIKVQK